MGRRWSLPLLLVLLLHTVGRIGAFESDELDDEWGLIGGAPPSSQSPAAAAARAAKRAAAAAPAAADGAVDPSKVQFELEHAFGGSDFTPAGVFNARLRPSARGQAMGKLRLSRLPFSEADQAAFQDLLKEDGFYTIRVPATPLKPGNVSVISSIKARCLAASSLKERFDFYMDQLNIISVSYSSGAECPYPREVKHISKWVFDSNIFLKTGEQASRSVFLNEAELGLGDATGDEAVQVKKLPEKSFWAKYWMYIIPLGLIIMNAVTQVANLQDEQQGAAGSPAQPSQQAAAASRPAIRRR